ncbi:hypothetical protein [Bacillus kexueae]|uniref:hypothetical protein n=1 Tax=Aeribacillus kexueae TaxID=2078952 RepID=UPI001FAF13B1|nr:hypothetical protein [Bacillus kexueae]
MKKMLIVFSLILTILYGCSEEHDLTEGSQFVTTPTNIYDIYEIELGLGIKDVKDVLGEIEFNEKDLVEYNENLMLGFDEDNKLNIISTSSPKILVKDELSVGSSKNQIIDLYKDSDIYEFSDENTDLSWIYLIRQKYKIVFEIYNDKIVRITVGTTPLINLINLEKDIIQKSLEDSEILSASKYLSFLIGKEKNNRLVLDDEFVSYAKFGLIKKVPIPIGMDINEVLKRYGEPSFISEYESEKSYWYRKFNVNFIVDSTGKISAIQVPIHLKVNDVMSHVGDPDGIKSLDDDKIRKYHYELGDYHIDFYTEPLKEDTFAFLYLYK